jgi:hypothetical protein
VKLSPIDVQIGAADAGVADSHQHFAAPDVRVRSVAKVQSSIAGENGSFHGVWGCPRRASEFTAKRLEQRRALGLARRDVSANSRADEKMTIA